MLGPPFPEIYNVVCWILTIFKWQLLNDLRNFKTFCHSGWGTLSPCMHSTLCALYPVCI